MPTPIRSLLLYLALVGLPLAGLAGILHAGRGLHAPPAIGGAWRVDALSIEQPAPSWAAQAMGAGRVLEVSQSGVHLSVTTAGGVRMSGRLAGDTLVTALAPARGPAAGCDARTGGMLLAARLEPGGGAMRMRGTLSVLSVPGSRACPVAGFRATRVAAGRGRGGP
jgi:hypothetical protein